MADYNLEQQLQRLSDLLKSSGCREQTQIEQLIKEILSYRDPIAFYQDLFEGEFQEASTRRAADLLQIVPDRPGRILFLRLGETLQLDSVKELLCSALESTEGQNDCIPMEKGEFAIVYDIEKEDDAKEFAFAMIQSIREELACEVMVGMSGVFKELKEIPNAYKQARTALHAGKKLLGNDVFYAYEDLGLAKVVWEMNPGQCRQFLAESLTPEAERELQNKEMLESIDIFFRYDLNISVAARELYVHRNTLVYRIEKFNKASGYNLSDFRDAALMQFVLMVRRKISDD